MSDKAKEVFTNVLKNSKEVDPIARVEQAMKAMNIQILKDLPLELRINSLLGLMSKSEGKDNSIFDFKLINEIINSNNDEYSYNLIKEIKSMDDLVSLRESIMESIFFNEGFRKCTCKKCKEDFTLTFGEVEFYRKKGFPLPRTCKYCKKGIEKPKKIEPKKESIEEEHIPTAMELALKNIKLS